MVDCNETCYNHKANCIIKHMSKEVLFVLDMMDLGKRSLVDASQSPGDWEHSIYGDIFVSFKDQTQIMVKELIRVEIFVEDRKLLQEDLQHKY